MNPQEAINEERERARQIIEFTSTHLFLTGKAGTGKTTFLKELREDAPKRMIVLAPTGIAAINAGGSTIHSFFQLPFAPFIPDEHYKKMDFKLRKQKIKLIRSLELIVIDEISMVRADLLDHIDAVLRQYRNRYEPFGGVQMLMIGDLQQLAPVAKEEEWNLLRNYYESPYFFSSHALQQTQYVTIELQKVYRQSDPVFLNMLNHIRSNTADEQILAQLNQRYLPDFQPKENESYIRLVTHNWQAQQINERELAKIKEKTYTFQANIDGIFPEYAYPADATLSLKRGAQVMFVKNDLEKRYYNGTLGEVIDVNEKGAVVRTADRKFEIKLEQEEWQNTRYALNEKTQEIEEKVEGCFHQFPLKLAWAITIHKSQGLTFEHAIIDAHSSFAHGQTYVALSRCKTLEGMVLSSPIPASAIIQDSAVCHFNQQMNHQLPSENTIHILKNNHCLKLINSLFDFSSLRYALESTIRLLEENFKKLYPETLKRYEEMASPFNDKILIVTDKFKVQYYRLVTSNPGDGIPDELQERLRKGATYFHKELLPLMELVENTVLPSDNKEIKKRTNDLLGDFRQEIHKKCQMLAYVANKGFDIIDFQKRQALTLADLDIDENGEPIATDSNNKKNISDTKETLAVPSEIQHPDLYKKLHLWRRQKADEEQSPVYLIMQNKALLGIANILPMDQRTLNMIPYFGSKSMENYGEEILEIIHQYVKDNNITVSEPLLTEKVPHEENQKTKVAKEPSAKISIRLYKELNNVEAVAKERGLAVSTIYGHLLQGIQNGDLEIEKLVSPEKIKAIRQYVDSQQQPETLKLTDIRNSLGEKFEYAEIRAVMLQYQK